MTERDHQNCSDVSFGTRREVGTAPGLVHPLHNSWPLPLDFPATRQQVGRAGHCAWHLDPGLLQNAAQVIHCLGVT